MDGFSNTGKVTRTGVADARGASGVTRSGRGDSNPRAPSYLGQLIAQAIAIGSVAVAVAVAVER
jgi:hypothetical protein